MKIEILVPGKMTQSGSSLFKLIQNNNTPSLDLFVRESVQNSLDARKEDSKYVSVEFLTGSFESGKLSAELEGIEQALSNRYTDKNCTYLAVRDSGTVGLTGETDYAKVVNNKYGNVLKLIYEICRPQENEGAGGSWGIGKTVYFRMGIGLVIYYSRILNDDGNYESRLAASLVEDECGDNPMIPVYRGMPRNGIAWWGQPTEKENDTVPVTDEEYINSFIDIFGIEPYTGDQTGTTIIMPYTDEKELLENNRIEHPDSLIEPVLPFWYDSVEKYLQISLQRWYAPRLVNPDYPYGPFLRALINGRGIAREDMEPVFRLLQSMYNRANNCGEDDFTSENGLDIQNYPVIVNNLLDDKVAGTLVCVKVSRENLKMNVPDNKPEPSVYFNCEQEGSETNKPFVCFVRKPGMIVSYENNSKWAPGNVTTNKNEYIFGFFVLHSLNKFKLQNIPVGNIEEYVRKSEMADHTTWGDWSAPGFNPRLVSRIQTNVSRRISAEYVASSEDRKTKENSAISKLLGDLLLPPTGFGTQPDPGPKPPKPDPAPSKGKKFIFRADPSKIRYYDDYMEIPMTLKTTGDRKIRHTAFDILIDTESGKSRISEWVGTLGLEAPFTVEKVRLLMDMFDGEKTDEKLFLDNGNRTASYGGMVFSLRTENGVTYGMDVSSDEGHSVSMGLVAVLHLMQRDVRPAVTFEKEV